MSRTRRFGEEQMLEGLRAAAEEVGEPLIGDRYDEYREDHPSLATRIWIIRAFGSWSEACARAGVKANPGRARTRRWTEEQVLGYVRSYLVEAGPTGSFAGYGAWAREADGAPSGPALRTYFKWSEARRRALGE